MSIAFRVDKSELVGSGHFYRSLNIAKVLKKKKINVKFICKKNNLTKDIKKELKENKINLNEIDYKKNPLNEDANQTIKILKKNKTKLLIVDNYNLNYKWESSVKKYVNKLLVIDDLANRKHNCEILLDQNYVENFANRYKKYINKNCRTFLGPRYVLLNPNFSKIKKKIKKNKVKNIFIFFSSSFQKKLTGIIYNVFKKKKFKELKINFIVGHSSNKNKLIKKFKNENYKTYIFKKNIINLMKKSDLAIGAGGSNSWERISLGLPSLAICLSDNQKSICSYLKKKKLIIYLGESKDVNVKKIENEVTKAIRNISKLRKISSSGQTIIDGKGSLRISELISPTNEKKLELRLAKKEDCFDYFQWINDPKVRKNSFISRKIKLNEHKKWFYKKIKNKKSKLYILEASKLPVGQIRFDFESSEILVDYSLDPIVRERGWGQKLIKLGMKKLKKKSKNNFLAKVKPFNYPSVSTFTKLGFERKNLNNKIYFYKSV